MRMVIPLSLHPENDADILDWLADQPGRGRSAAIRQALRAYLTQQRITLTDVYQAIRELQQQTRPVPASPVMTADTAEDPEISHNLDELLGL